MVRIWEYGLRQRGQLWPVILLVVYHGAARWTVATNFQGLSELPEALRLYVPGFRYHLSDLSAYSDEEIKQTAELGMGLLVLKHIFRAELRAHLPDVMSLWYTIQDQPLQKSSTFMNVDIEHHADTDETQLRSGITRLAHGASISLIGRLLGRIIFAVTQVAFARLLGPENFGLYSLGWTFLRLAGVVASLGLESGVIQFAGRYWRTDMAALKNVLFKSIRTALLAGTVIGLGLYTLAPMLARVFQDERLELVFQLFALMLPFVTGLAVTAAATNASQRIQFSIYAQELAQPSITLLLFCMVYFLGYRLVGAITASFIGYVISFAIALRFVFVSFPLIRNTLRAGGPSTKQILSYSLPTAFAGSFGLLILWSDRLFIGYFRTTEDVGIYQAVSQIPIIFAIVLRALNSIFTPMISDLHHHGRYGQLEQLFRISTKWGIYLTLPLYLVVCFVPDKIMAVIFGKEYLIGSLPLVILATAQFINVATGAVSEILIMTGHQRAWMNISLVSFILNIVLNFMLVPHYGLLGASVSTTASTCLLFLLTLFWVRRVLHIWPYDMRYHKGGIATIVTTSGLISLYFVEFPSPVAMLFIYMILGIVLFVSTLYLLGLDVEDKQLIGVMFPALRKSRNTLT